MNCSECRARISHYLDGELAAEAKADFERHLEGCAECRAELAEAQRISAALRGGRARYAAPAHLRARIRSEIGQSERPSILGTLRLLGVGWNPVALAASFLLAIVASAGLTASYLGGADHEALLARDVVAGQIRSLMASHITDIASSDQHKVKPWFNGKLDFSPPVVDLAADGFPLAGGRLDYIGHQSVAALVYRRRDHVINLFIWPEDGDKPLRFESQQGYNLAYYKHGGMEYWAVSDLGQAELKEFMTHLMNAKESPA
ncbi:MAG TPA: anti-sigma factor [Stellaceae bacterium]|nr:anti-sigma factor [Stellaceae bacterium]